MNETAMPIPPIGHSDCTRISEILGRVGDKWTILIIVVLHGRAHRFNEVRRVVKGISQQMLTRTLKNLERDGVVTRTVHPTVPPQVEYALTDLGRSLAEPVATMSGWAHANLQAINAKQVLHDERNARERSS